MNVRQCSTALIWCSALVSACSSDQANTDVITPIAPVVQPPSVAKSNGVLVLIADSAMSYDATKAGSTFTTPSAVTYLLSIGGVATGLGASGGTLLGTPTAPGVFGATLTATDAQGRSATDAFTIVVFASGLLTPVLPSSSFSYADAALLLPAHFTSAVNGITVAATDNQTSANIVTDPGATLGRVLFYDTRLSANDATSCASCHAQELGFSAPTAFSLGFSGGATTRHSPGLSNTRFYQRGRYFWDERAATLEAQALGPIQNAVEMGMTLENLVIKLNATPFYAPLFTAAFGSPTVTSSRVSLAVAQYMRALVSTNSRYDHAFTSTGIANFAASFTAEEQTGEALFRTQGCASCHVTVSQVSDTVHNIGLDAVTVDTGAGRGAFKAPSLRNVGVRTHFMHDGRFTSLAQVVAFFNAGVQPNASLDVRLRATDGTPKRLNLSAVDQSALVAFLRTLTDSTFLTNAKYSNPFAVPAFIPPVTPTNASVTIHFTAYQPQTITVPPGSIITFTNLDNSRHSATFTSPLIAGTPIFTSGSRVVPITTVPGSYHFQCAVHGAAMSGTVIVK